MPGANKTLYAVIIGINAYPRSPLYGCVNDALAVHQFCSQLADSNDDIKDYQPLLLLAPHEGEDDAALREYNLSKSDYQSPTRNNIIKAFSHFKQAKAENEDICLFYYSGHGSFQPAPELFWDLKSGKQVESLVCVDSRVRGGRDLIDKELAYLLWDAINDKAFYQPGKAGIHTVLIMDCCHSGDNTRGGVRARMEQPNPNRTPISDYAGYKESLEKSGAVESDKAFLKALEMWRSARYVHLAAARDKETAKETMLEDRSSGVFTYSLLKTLRSGGMQLSYQELIERIKVMVRNRVEDQIPLVFATEPKDTQMTFMGRQLKEPSREYVTYFDPDTEEWKINAGANAGIVPSNSDKEPTVVKVWRKSKTDEVRKTEVVAVEPASAVLDGSVFSGEDEAHEDWIARITLMSAPKIKVSFDESVGDKERKYLENAAAKVKVPTYEFVGAAEDAAFVTYQVGEDYVLAKKNSLVPVFKRNSDPDKFLAAVGNVGQWMRVLELNNQETEISRGEIEVRVEVVEGEQLSYSNLNSVPAASLLKDPSEIKVAYKRIDAGSRGVGKHAVQPGIRVRIRTKDRPYYVACLFMDSLYGMTSNLDSTEVDPDGNGEWIKFSVKGEEYRTIPLNVDDNYHKLGITEITDYLKIFVSTEEFPIKSWEQESLKLDDKLIKIDRIKKKSMGLMEDASGRGSSDWMSFTIPVRISRPLPQQEQSVGGAGKNVAQIGGARLTVPQGFSARVSAASEAEIKDMVNTATERSVDGADKLRTTLMPPPIVWGAAPSRNAVFSRSVSAAAPDTQLSVLEITAPLGDNIISEENPILFEPEGGLTEDEVLVSFAYDEDSGMYLPLGFSDEEGQLHIENLPKATPGKIIGDESINERSLSGSIKLFFKKVVIGSITGQTNNNKLARCSLGEDGVSVATAVGDGALADPKLKNICLLVHGIIGDTEGQRQAFFENDSKLHEYFDAVISYDYENLNTPIEETAKLLKSDLAKAGITGADGKRLTIVAHSMGGLVSRWFIEHEGGDEMVHQLIQMGTPNGGSETSDFRKSVFGMMSMAMNGAAFLKPYLPVLSFIGKRVTKAVFHTLNQMSPTESDFLKALNKDGSPNSGVPYTVIGGDTNAIKPEKMDDQPLLKQFWLAVKQKAPYVLLNKLVFKSEDPNDMAVTQVSMQKVPTQDTLPFHSVACDHISYFCYAEAMAKLQEILEQQRGG
ncbi:caspase family protein [Flavilitoribacter nigricans]|uniref:Uncharacterized protein n=1 Tax=Flavilitoribacter nigricans (strain ATCC 23147 / DSM 23189 / NBRC 102662 / NCIMB 1420 / SS-2) TaxID=1122177 RepID=A0A2D0MY53_FLAN2|nr:caspase family protein [Flavilitoribacter nigricans]PHN01194.1 hypothetical protein CRP01_38280 [Flavilitoribacter nigricans DSM 23189 = NBRC 102662]